MEQLITLFLKYHLILLVTIIIVAILIIAQYRIHAKKLKNMILNLQAQQKNMEQQIKSKEQLLSIVRFKDKSKIVEETHNSLVHLRQEIDLGRLEQKPKEDFLKEVSNNIFSIMEKLGFFLKELKELQDKSKE